MLFPVLRICVVGIVGVFNLIFDIVLGRGLRLGLWPFYNHCACSFPRSC